MEIGLRDLVRTLALMAIAFALFLLLLFFRDGAAVATDPLVAVLAILLVCAGLFDLIWLNAKRKRMAGSQNKLSASDLRQNHIALGRRIIRRATVGSVTIFSLVALYHIVELLRR